ncbi:MAG: TonB-dependent receptor, partial [Flavobacteriales bacterium]
LIALLVFLASQSLAQVEVKTSFWVDGVCGMCQERIEKAAKIKGVSSASWDVETSMLAITFDAKKVKLYKIHEEIAKVGHDTKQVKATQEAYDNVHGCCKYRDEEVINAHAPQNEPGKTSFWVDGVCGMCQDRIQGALKMKGINSSFWDVDTKMLEVDFDSNQITLMEIHEAIAAVGHDTKLVKAKQEIYDNIHGCCKYRDEEVIDAHAPDEEEKTSEGTVKGKVMEINSKGKKIPVFSANVYWLETTRGITSNKRGKFEIDKKPNEQNLVVSFVGLTSDTLSITDESEIEIVMSNSVQMKEFTVFERRKTIEISKISAMKVENMNKKELAKAACCNLSESFETNPSVDVSYTDAITGTKQIKMLGLAGANIQITKELMPDIRGFSSFYGMEFVPGDWIESIQLTKGIGSVNNGYESIAGQINVELKKPEESEKFHVNLYANQGGRYELNTNFKLRVNENWNTGFLLHHAGRVLKNDLNNDGFLDNPLTQHFIGINRWKYEDTTGLMGQIALEGVMMDAIGGQVDFDKNQTIDTLNPWGANTKIRRLRGWAKMGKVFYDQPGKSIALQTSFSTYDQSSLFGLNTYEAKQNSGYLNFIYQNLIGTTDHTYFMGASVLYDDYKETVNGINYDRVEVTPGFYGEYTYSGNPRFKSVLGLRADYSNVFGFFVTPRLHLKYDFTETTIGRLAFGRGQRTANIFSENQALFATSRNIVVNGDVNSNKPYGLEAEVAWNLGVNLTQDFKIGDREGVFSIDLYRTEFQNQIVVDWENPDEIAFYNLQGESYSNSIQVQVDYELIENLDLRMAYRFYDIKTTFGDATIQKQLTAPHRAFINLGYETEKKWNFDFTLNWIGEQRIASTESNPVAFQMPNESPSYFLANAQISKSWKDKFDVYLGVENLFDFRIDKPIIDSENPFGNNFDSSLVWAPIFGRNIYLGLRYSIK